MRFLIHPTSKLQVKLLVLSCLLSLAYISMLFYQEYTDVEATEVNRAGVIWITPLFLLPLLASGLLLLLRRVTRPDIHAPLRTVAAFSAYTTLVLLLMGVFIATFRSRRSPDILWLLYMLGYSFSVLIPCWVLLTTRKQD
jgi:multisubunit Na+/H+ antiporter MnhF subunit